MDRQGLRLSFPDIVVFSLVFPENGLDVLEDISQFSFNVSEMICSFDWKSIAVE